MNTGPGSSSSVASQGGAPPRSARKASSAKSFHLVQRHGRTFAEDERNPYPLPCDARELSRQSLMHELYKVVLGGRLHCVDFDDAHIPRRVLDIGCGTGIWIQELHEEFAARGHPNVEFVGMDVVPVYTDMTGINFTWVKGDLAVHPLPFADEEFDFVFIRDVSMGMTVKALYDNGLVQDCLRIMKPGGTFEIEEMDHTIRSLLRSSIPYNPKSSAYPIMPSTQFAQQSDNQLVAQWNERVENALNSRGISPVPCTFVGPILLMEEEITGVQQKRLALPFDEVWWESSSAPIGSDASDNSSVNSRRKSSGGSSIESVAGSARRRYRRSSTSAGSGPPSPLTDEEKAVRQMARLCFTQMIDAMEYCIREANGISVDEWDRWYKEIMYNWNEGGGLHSGECLEYGCWWGQKRIKPTKVRPLGIGSA